LGAVGGLIGQQTGSTVINSYATGDASSTLSGSAAFLASNIYVGGLIGYSTGVVTGSSATGSVSNTVASFNCCYSSEVGGLIGYSGGAVSDSHATGAVTNSGSSGYVGGLIGYQSGSTVANSFATGNVSNTADNSSCCNSNDV